MSTCKTCKYWDSEILDPIHFKGERENMRLCNNEDLCDMGDNKLSAGETWGSAQRPMTGPNFGCVHHEKL